MKTVYKLIILLLALCGLAGCAKKTRSTQHSELKKESLSELLDKSTITTTKKGDSTFVIKGSSLEKEFTPGIYNPGIEADSLDSMESENADLRIKTIVNKKTGKIKTQGTAKSREVHLAVDEKKVENRNVSETKKEKTKSRDKQTEKVKEPAPQVNKIFELLEWICVISVVVAGIYLGLRFGLSRSEKRKVSDPRKDLPG